MINFRRFLSARGFTLLELLVVISIIGILIAMGAVSYTTAQVKARDARRRSDMQNWGKALEQFYSASATAAYPTDASCNPGVAYLPAGAPVDPKNTGSYMYTPSLCGVGGAAYCLCALLESGTGGNASNASCSFVSGNTGTHFCVRNQQ